MAIAALIGVNVGLTVSFRRLFLLSVVGQLLIGGYAILEDLQTAPVFVPFLLLALVIQLAAGVVFVRAGRGPVPWSILRWLFTAGAGLLTLRIAAIALPRLAEGSLFSFLLFSVMFLVPSVGQIALMWWAERQGLRSGTDAV